MIGAHRIELVYSPLNDYPLTPHKRTITDRRMHNQTISNVTLLVY
jgi:hypothetical protein